MGCGMIRVMMLPRIAACLVLLLTLFSCQENDQNYITDFDQKRMDAAIAEAKANLDQFDAALRAGLLESSSFFVKKGFAYGEDGREFMWLVDVRVTDGGFEGKVDNVPVNPVKVKLGERVVVAREDVADWMIRTDSGLQGAYTLVALACGSDRMEAEELKEMGIDKSKYEFLKKGK